MAKTALVLSAGGMFGAYQAGVWKVLADHFQPAAVEPVVCTKTRMRALAACGLLHRQHPIDGLRHDRLTKYGPGVDVVFFDGRASEAYVAAARPVRLFPIRFTVDIDGYHYALSSDGHRILAAKETGQQRSRDLNVVFNWPQLLSKEPEH